MGLLRRPVLGLAMGLGMGMGMIALAACQTVPEPVDADVPVVTQAWDSVRIGTYDNADFARLFTDIGGYSVTYSDEDVMVLRQGNEGASVILERMPPDAPQARPADAASWEPGCYWSLMVRARDIASIVADARPLGWEPKTPVAYLEFGPSKLNVVVLTHQDTGAQVQMYERLTTPLPEDYPAFERFGVPFNIMQMASDRDATYRFFAEDLGFATWYHGEPTRSATPEVMPLGIPVELTTIVPYRASIVSPVAGMETGRFEMIEVMGEEAGLTGRDFSNRCDSGSVGLTEVRYRVGSEDVRRIREAAKAEPDVTTSGRDTQLLKAPDGAAIRFVGPQDSTRP
ncbi:MAG: hypothetical protein WBG08_05950 [Litorimonas sp.]